MSADLITAARIAADDLEDRVIETEEESNSPQMESSTPPPTPVDPLVETRQELQMYLKMELLQLSTNVTKLHQQQQGILNDIRQYSDEITRKQTEVSQLKMNIAHNQGLIAGVKKVQAKLIESIGIEEG